MTGAVFGVALCGALTALSFWVAPLPSVPPQVAAVPPTVYEAYSPAEAPTGPLDAPKAVSDTVTAPLPIDGDCDGFVELAAGVGWPASELGNLRDIMFAESACTTTAVGDNGNSRGLLQIHCPTWVEKSTYWPDGWAAANGYPITCDDLHDVRTNLAIGFLIWVGVDGSAGGWGNWSTWQP